MLAEDAHAALTVRPPWAEELRRVGDLAQGLKESAFDWNLHALVAERPERIVGLAGLGVKESEGYMHIGIRPRFRDTGGGRMLLDKLIAQARELGVERMSIQVQTDAPMDRFLQTAGFKSVRTEEVWKVDLLRVRKRLERISKRWNNKQSWKVRGIEPADLPAIAELIAPYERVEADRLHIRRKREPYGNSYEGSASSVVETEGQIMAALLCKGTPGLTGYIEFRIVGKAYRKYSGVLGAMMLHRSTLEALKDDYRTVLFTVDMSRDFETRNLAERMSGTLVRKVNLLKLDLG